ncbi:gliding motility-associated C-terminal domain-containing protein [Chitinophaga sp. CF118]|uniref:M43 family zinc metalloprotease n=1 Tax=Chitinophaga sp. CF118 TaxID=1884367 RepID=UPI0008DEF131|nr:gliding motility-associated C-terminal domain-containing protein [Chitinophaga sp. CF118]SFD77557.1 gliding motility-associated C-terminal domain-containing protein [Chitinophaga sp. CF118]
MLRKNLQLLLLPYLIVTYNVALAQMAVPQQPGEPSRAAVWQAGHPRSCGTDMMLNTWRQDATFVKKEININKAVRRQAARAADYTLPVVFHIINEDPASITDQNILDALDMLNQAYGKTGAFAGARADTRISFCLAKTAPDGGLTTGILRTKSFLTDFDADMEGEKLTALGRWDPTRYLNIWVVSDIKSEFMQSFECGQWTRLKMAGYASAGGEVVVAGLGVDLLAHEVGHYLSLIHTFAAQDCRNDDCTTDGDMVCDTPPDRSIAGGFACSNPENSCNTDTLSGFTTDVPDLPDNFMDYGGGVGCIMSFTDGQGTRMRNFIASSLPGMINSTVCTPPCTSTAVASFTKNIDYPVIGDIVNLTNTSTGATSYEWLVNDVVVATTTDFSYQVTAKQNYRITLRAYTAPGCFTLAQDMLSVSCGVVSRFYPDKRKIASKENIQLDSILFTNRSINANNYRWLMSNNKGMTEQVVSTVQNLTYVFKIPGTYKVRLIADNGSCIDTTNPVTIVVDDPTTDGVVYVTKVECYEQNKLKISLFFNNFGYKSIPKNTPVSFYNRDPRTGNAVKLGDPYLIPYEIKGKCASYLETFVLNAGRSGLDTVVAVFNDDGTSQPFVLPNPLDTLIESNYNNNYATTVNFKFRIQLQPSDIVLTPDQQVVLTPTSTGTMLSGLWTPASYIDCDKCVSTTFTAPYRKDTLLVQQVKITTDNNCYDSAFVTIHIPPVDDYVVNISETECAKGDSIYVTYDLCNNFATGNIPPGLQVDFYDNVPLATSFVTTGYSTGQCASFSKIIKNTANGQFFAAVNKNNAWPETDTLNNSNTGIYVFPSAKLTPADTTVYRGSAFPITFQTNAFDPVAIAWQTGDQYTLSCTSCAVPSVKVWDSSLVKVTLTSLYGCTLTPQGIIKLVPPDLTVQLTDVKCYDNTHSIVTFTICTSNGYDSIKKQLPVAFYDADPLTDTAHLLTPVFSTLTTEQGVCRDYTHIISTPATAQLYAVVNAPGTFRETIYDNNTDDVPAPPFTATFDPAVIQLSRPGNVQLKPVITGGETSKYTWVPVEGLSCSTCANPTATVSSSIKYLLEVNNEYYCTDTANIYLQTFTSSKFAIPSAFTPNGDGVNDIFYIIGSRDIKLVKSFIIFNRWGNKVFETANIPANDKSYGWKGSNADAGAYVYFANVTFADGSTEVVKGSIMLIK